MHTGTMPADFVCSATPAAEVPPCVAMSAIEAAGGGMAAVWQALEKMDALEALRRAAQSPHSQPMLWERRLGRAVSAPRSAKRQGQARPASACSSFRLTCKAAAAMTSSLITEVDHLVLGYDPDWCAQDPFQKHEGARHHDDNHVQRPSQEQEQKENEQQQLERVDGILRRFHGKHTVHIRLVEGGWPQLLSLLHRGAFDHLGSRLTKLVLRFRSVAT